MARWKLSASKILEILRLSTCTLCQQKSYISKVVPPIFEIFASARRRWGWAFGWKVSWAQVFYFCTGKVNTLPSTTFEIFATLNLYTVPAKIPYLQSYSTDILNLCLSSKALRVGIWEESLRFAGILLLLWQGEKFAHRQHLKFWHFQPIHCASQNPISKKVFNRFSKSLPQLVDVEGGHLGEKFQVRRYFAFAMARWKLCASTTFWYFATFNLYTVPAKIQDLQRYSTNFRKLLLHLNDVESGHFGGNFQVQVFYFCNGKVKPLRIDNIWNFPLSTGTLCQLKSYISKGIQPLFEIFASALRCWGWEFGWNVSGSQVFYFCNGKVKIFAHRQHLKFCHFQPLHGASKKPISIKVFNPFSKSLPQLVDVVGGHLGEKFQVRWYFAFAMARWKLCASTTFWNLATFNLYTVPAKIQDLRRYSTNFRKLFLSSTMLRLGIWVKRFRIADILLLQWQGENFAHRQHLKFCHFQLVHCAS